MVIRNISGTTGVDVVLDSGVDVPHFPKWCRSSLCAAPLAHEAPCKAALIQSRGLQSMTLSTFSLGTWGSCSVHKVMLELFASAQVEKKEKNFPSLLKRGTCTLSSENIFKQLSGPLLLKFKKALSL